MKKLSIKLKLESSVTALANMKLGGKVFGKEYSQFDRVFLPRDYKKHYKTIDQVPHLIIRTNSIGGQMSHLMILKRIVDQNLVHYYQTQIMDYNQTAHIVNNMGYELHTEVAKKRRKMVAGSIVAYLDYIDKYGWFFKIEKNLKEHETEDINELWDILVSLELQHSEKASRYSQILTGEEQW